MKKKIEKENSETDAERAGGQEGVGDILESEGRVALDGGVGGARGHAGARPHAEVHVEPEEVEGA